MSVAKAELGVREVLDTGDNFHIEQYLRATHLSTMPYQVVIAIEFPVSKNNFNSFYGIQKTRASILQRAQIAVIKGTL